MLSLGQNVAVVIKTESAHRKAVVSPDVAVDLRLLGDDLAALGHLGDEKYDLLEYLSARAILAEYAEAVEDLYIKACLLKYFAFCGGMLVLTDLDVTLRKTPVAALFVLYEKIFKIAAAAAEHDRPAGLFT